MRWVGEWVGKTYLLHQAIDAGFLSRFQKGSDSKGANAAVRVSEQRFHVLITLGHHDGVAVGRWVGGL